MNKVVLPYNVARAIENIKKRLEGEVSLFNYPNIALHAAKNPDYNTINIYINQSVDNFRNYYAAISIGYEVEKSPEEKVKERYEYYRTKDLNVSANAIKETVDLLGIKIAGINV